MKEILIHNDHVRNKMDPAAIVYRDDTGSVTRLTAEDFNSKEEFDAWKQWSDEDYHRQAKSDRAYYDHTVSVSPEQIQQESVCSSVGTDSDTASQARKTGRKAVTFSKVKHILTRKQFRRFYLYYIKGMSQEDIAKKEKVSQASVCESIAAAERKLADKL